VEICWSTYSPHGTCSIVRLGATRGRSSSISPPSPNTSGIPPFHTTSTLPELRQVTLSVHQFTYFVLLIHVIIMLFSVSICNSSRIFTAECYCIARYMQQHLLCLSVCLSVCHTRRRLCQNS